MDHASESRTSNLFPPLVTIVRSIYDTCFKAGHPIILVSGYRSIDEQNVLYRQGRTTPGHIVTNAQGGHSTHNYGLAVDLMPLKPGSTTELEDTITAPSYQFLIKTAKAQGLAWGGDWIHFKDYPHFQMYNLPANPSSAMLAALLAAHDVALKTVDLPVVWKAFDSGRFGVAVA